MIALLEYFNLLDTKLFYNEKKRIMDKQKIDIVEILYIIKQYNRSRRFLSLEPLN